MSLDKHFFIICFAVIFSYTRLAAQVINGEVLDSETNEPIPFANVYFNASNKGTITDADGKFELKQVGYEGQAVIISCVGYESWVLDDYQQSKYYKVLLLSSKKILKEIVVKPDDWSIERKRKVFMRQFFGNSVNANDCYIENIDDLILLYIKNANTLEGYSYKPLIIHNHGLGYKITYYLKEFIWNKDRMYYQGYSLFEKDTCSDSVELKKLTRRRRKAYYNSRMQFFRTLFSVKNQNLKLYIELDGKEVETYDYVIEEKDETTKFLLPKSDIRIVLDNKRSQILFREKKKVLFTKDGYFDPRYIVWSGDLSSKRFADLLPYEYWPNK